MSVSHLAKWKGESVSAISSSSLVANDVCLLLQEPRAVVLEELARKELRLGLLDGEGWISSMPVRVSVRVISIRVD